MTTTGGQLPLQGFVLAGGAGSRMGRDKALLPFQCRPLVEIALEKLRTFCASAAIAGNRDDLRAFAQVISETRGNAGPIAGLEAGLQAAAHPWSLFLPVDVPLVSASLLAAWARAVLAREPDGLRLSILRANGERQSTFCLLHRECLPALTAAADAGTHKLAAVFDGIAASLGPNAFWVAEAETFAESADLAAAFTNLNTPEDVAALELWCRSLPPNPNAVQGTSSNG